VELRSPGSGGANGSTGSRSSAQPWCCTHAPDCASKQGRRCASLHHTHAVHSGWALHQQDPEVDRSVPPQPLRDCTRHGMRRRRMGAGNNDSKFQLSRAKHLQASPQLRAVGCLLLASPAASTTAAPLVL
jgi:hypothetical protein